ncbi:hypothetical protein MKLM6_3823 [Methylomonas koyamae]|nr:hypothetical protein MKLM6_3823 [Methylomonas koyamae]
MNKDTFRKTERTILTLYVYQNGESDMKKYWAVLLLAMARSPSDLSFLSRKFGVSQMIEALKLS